MLPSSKRKSNPQKTRWKITKRYSYSTNPNSKKNTVVASEVELNKTVFNPEAEFMNTEAFGRAFESSQTLSFHIKCLHYIPVSNHFCSGGGGGVKSVVKVTVNSKEENFLDFCPSYVQEFCLWKGNPRKTQKLFCARISPFLNYILKEKKS